MFILFRTLSVAFPFAAVDSGALQNWRGVVIRDHGNGTFDVQVPYPLYLCKLGWMQSVVYLFELSIKVNLNIYLYSD
jgi:hypothetical protein